MGQYAASGCERRRFRGAISPVLFAGISGQRIPGGRRLRVSGYSHCRADGRWSRHTRADGRRFLPGGAFRARRHHRHHGLRRFFPARFLPPFSRPAPRIRPPGLLSGRRKGAHRQGWPRLSLPGGHRRHRTAGGRAALDRPQILRGARPISGVWHRHAGRRGNPPFRPAGGLLRGAGRRAAFPRPPGAALGLHRPGHPGAHRRPVLHSAAHRGRRAFAVRAPRYADRLHGAGDSRAGRRDRQQLPAADAHPHLQQRASRRGQVARRGAFGFRRPALA